MNRQINFLLNNYKYEDGKDDGNKGILIPRYIATGRTAPDGKVYGPVKTKNEDEKVLVRSIITKSENFDIVTPDLLSTRLKKASFPEGSAIGVSLASTLSESTTQSILRLKHGGHERILDASGNMYAQKDCELIEDGRWLVVKSGRKEERYPRPDNWVGMGKTQFKEGEIIGSSYHTTSPVYKLNAVIRLMNAKGSAGKKYYEKDQISISDCYAYEDGIIKYVEDKKGNLKVMIGSREYAYSPESRYFFPDGAKVKKLQRFCTGVVDMRVASNELGGDISSIFAIFRDQYYSLTSKSFQKDHTVSPGDMQEEIVELVFAGLTKIIPDVEKGKIASVEYQGTQTAVLDRNSFFTTLSYGWSGRVVKKAVSGDLALSNDIMTDTILGLLLHDKLDKTRK